MRMLLQRVLRGIAASRTCARARRARTLLVLLAATASVTCSVDELTFTRPPVTIGVTVTGLDGAGLVLTNNGGDDLVISGDGAFTFATPLERGASYALAVKSQPSNPTQTCSITNGNGTAGDADVIDVQVSCHTTTLRVGGTVTGLAGSGLVLQNNAGDSLVVSADGAFTFATPLSSGASYDVTVAMQPALPTQECTVANGTGTVGTSDVTDIVVTCTTRSFTIGGTVTGLSGTGLVLQNNGGDDLAVGADGSFTFATPIESGAMFAVTVLAQPSGPSQICTVAGGTGTVGGGDVTSVAINCMTNRYMIGGTISGLIGTVTLQNNGGDDLAVTANGMFAFATPVASGASYDVTVLTQPTMPWQTCRVTAGSGTVTNADITSVVVICTTNRYPIGGKLSGLASGNSITLQNNAGDDLVLSANGDFSFPTPVPSGQPYSVTLVADATSPVSQKCTVTSGAGLVGGSDVTSVRVTCSTNAFTIGGTVTGLAGSGLVLQNNGGDDLPIGGDGPFTFPAPVASGATFVVTVLAQPAGPSQTCTVAGGTGTVGAGDVTSVAINCTTNRYTIGGTITGLVGTSLVLQNNGGDDLDVTANGTFAFPVPVLSGETYAVTVLAQPSVPAQTCTVTADSGTVTSADVTSVVVTCTTNRYTIGGKLSGLAAGNSITLRDNGGDDLVLSANGNFTFATPVESGQLYAVTVVANPTSPIAQTCTVTAGSGTVANANVTSVAVTCTTDRYSIGGTISGLAGTVTLRNTSNGDMASIATNGGFVFGTPVASGEPYNVIVVSQPTAPAQTCTVTGGTGTVTNASIHVVVTCTTNPYSIGGTLSGLAAGNSITLRNNGGNDLVLSANGNFTFATPVPSGLPYVVTIAAQPVSPIAQTCIVTNGTGTVGSSNVTNVQVTCVTNRYKIGGTISGLAGAGLVLQNNGGDNLAISANGNFTFATPLASGSTYAVTVLAQPTAPWQTCTVSGGTGMVGAGDVTSIAITCTTNRYSVGGTISGLTGGTLRLQNNYDGHILAVTGNGPFVLSPSVPSGATYDVIVVAQPAVPAQTCTVTAGSGMVTNANITSVVVTCTKNHYTIGGTLSGLAPGNSITLRNNGGDDLVRSANGGFTFATPVASGQPYAVTIVANPTSPISQKCTVNNGTGGVGSSNVTDVQITCTTNQYTIGGTVIGLTGTGLVLQNNGGDDLTINANGTFTFATPVASGATYSVAIKTQPSGKSCWVSGGTGTVGASNVTSVQVTCGAGTLVTINQITNYLQRVDASTLAVTDIGLLGVPYAFGDCAWNTADSTLYVIDGRPSNALYRINLATGAATLIGVHGITDMFSLAYHPPTNQLYGIGSDRNLYRLSTTTGAATLIGPTGIPFYVDGLAWDSKRSVMVALIAGSSVFYAVNVSTGAATHLHSTTSINNLGMTYDPVVDRFWVADYNRRFIEFDPNNNFARTQRSLLSGAYTCLAFVP